MESNREHNHPGKVGDQDMANIVVQGTGKCERYGGEQYNFYTYGK